MGNAPSRVAPQDFCERILSQQSLGQDFLFFREVLLMKFFAKRWRRRAETIEKL